MGGGVAGGEGSAPWERQLAQSAPTAAAFFAAPHSNRNATQPAMLVCFGFGRALCAACPHGAAHYTAGTAVGVDCAQLGGGDDDSASNQLRTDPPSCVRPAEGVNPVRNGTVLQWPLLSQSGMFYIK